MVRFKNPPSVSFQLKLNPRVVIKSLDETVFDGELFLARVIFVDEFLFAVTAREKFCGVK